MIFRSSFPMAVVLGLGVAGCAGSGARITPIAHNESVVKGTVAYRERIALPPDVVVEVWIADVSPLISVSVIAETSIRPESRQVPIPFELPYDPRKIAPDHKYAVKAAIRSGGRTIFATDTGQPVITQGQPTEVVLWLAQVIDEAASAPSGLQGTAWRLEDLGGAGMLDRVQATLEFPEAGKVAGNGSCNRFFGTVGVSGEAIKFGPLGSTRMACVEAVANQEGKYLKALQEAERFTLDGSTLLIYCKGLDKPLRFFRRNP